MTLQLTRPEWLWLLLLGSLLVCSCSRSLVCLSRKRKLTLLLARGAILVCLSLALAGLTLLRPCHEKFVVFLQDRSASIGPQGVLFGEEYKTKATQNVSPDRFAFLEFARSPRLTDHAVSDSSDIDWSAATDIAQGLQYALGIVPVGYVPEMVLLSDGQETAGDTRGEVKKLADRVSVSCVPIPIDPTPEVRLVSIHAPEQVRFGEPFHVEVEVGANVEENATIQLYRDDFAVARESVNLTPGQNSFSFRNTITDSKDHLFTASVAAPQDRNRENNKLSCPIYGKGPPRILVLDGSDQRPVEFLAALSAQQLDVTCRNPDSFSMNDEDLTGLDAIILVDVRADQLTTLQMERLRNYVRDSGGGLMMIGGDSSFGLGGYSKTPVEEILPVFCDFSREKELHSLGLALVVDRSGSMGGEKIELAKEAAMETAGLLGPRDSLSVLAFDSETQLVVPLQNMVSLEPVRQAIATLTAGGGTNMAPALEEAIVQLLGADARIKHVILLTDGYSEPGDFEGIVSRMVQNKITFSTIGIGEADQDLLKRLAQLGGGRHYTCDSPQAIPRIFARETATASKEVIRERPFVPVPVVKTSVLDGLALDGAPALLGFVVTRAKPTSEVILATETGEPLLAWWRFGLGMTAAFTSDVKTRWSSEWMTWPDYSRFWAQVVRHLLRPRALTGNQLIVKQERESIHLQVDLQDPAGEFLHDARVTVRVTDPSGTAREWPLTEEQPGRYESTLPVHREGIWYFQASAISGSETILLPPRGLAVAYPDEFRLQGNNEKLLSELATITQGQVNPDPLRLFEPETEKFVMRPIPLWPALLVTSLVLFLFDLFLKRWDGSFLWPGFRKATLWQKESRS